MHCFIFLVNCQVEQTGYPHFTNINNTGLEGLKDLPRVTLGSDQWCLMDFSES